MSGVLVWDLLLALIVCFDCFVLDLLTVFTVMFRICLFGLFGFSYLIVLVAYF